MMHDIEKVIDHLNDCMESSKRNDTWVFVRKDIVEDAIAMLQEQEAVEPYSMNAERTYGICPKCGKIVFRYGNVEENHYCGVCGQEVKWE